MTEEHSGTPRRSLYMQETIQQASVEEINNTRGLSPPNQPALNTFGQEFRLICQVCLQDLKRPKQLKSCYHIFCTDCLKLSIESSRDGLIECPACKTKCPEEDVSRAMESSTYLHAFKDYMSVYTESGDVSCSDIHHDQAVQAAYFCLECGQNFCDSCHSDHGDNETFRKHHCFQLFKTRTAMTVGMNRRMEESLEGAASEDHVDETGTSFQCPICRHYDQCDHEMWLKDLQNEKFRKDDQCPVPEHKGDGELIAFCTVCETPICRNCSMVEHKAHKTINIGKAMEEKLPELKSLKKRLSFQKEIFDDAAKSADRAEDEFKQHIREQEQEMVQRKGAVHKKVEEGFNIAFSLLEQTGQKQAELNKQSLEMHEEKEFLNAAIKLAENVSEESTPPVEMLKIWKGLHFIVNELEGEKKNVKEPEAVIPQDVEEKRLVLPAPNCMNPDLRILQKVGVEGKILHRSFLLKAEDELLLFYSILPLTETEALVSCKTQACATSIVQYSNISEHRYSVRLKEEGQYSIIAVPGKGIVATLYQAAGSCGGSEKRQVLFWDQALDRSMTELEAQGAGNELKIFAETEFPPRGVAVTKENHLVVCTAEDPKRSGGEGGSCCILLMTMRGDILRRESLIFASTDSDSSQYFPRYVTVNINDDICITDEKNRSVIILDRNLRQKLRIQNPYEKEQETLNGTFCPMGICHDSFGRLIVADNKNHAVIRIELNDVSSQPQILLKNGWDKLKDFSYPSMVALGPGPKLWVVCRDNIHVFDYMDKE